MDLSKATPIEIHEYKMSWSATSTPVRLHSDLDVKGKDWCRRHLERWEWAFSKYTDVYEHTFFFQYEDDAKEFKENFGRFADQ